MTDWILPASASSFSKARVAEVMVASKEAMRALSLVLGLCDAALTVMSARILAITTKFLLQIRDALLSLLNQLLAVLKVHLEFVARH